MRHITIVVLTLAFFATFAVAKDKKQTASELNCSSFKDEHDQEICLKAQASELLSRIDKVEKKVHRSEPESMRRIRRAEEKEREQYEKTVQLDQKYLSAAAITGCLATDEVWVNPIVTRTSNWVVSAAVRVINTSALPINVESARYGTLVKNLCPRGAVTLHFIMRPFMDSDQVQVPLTAIARPVDGGIATATYSVYLSRWQIQSQKENNQDWQVNVSRQYQTR